MAYEFMIEIAERYRMYRREWRRYVELIAEKAREFFGDNLYGVFVFAA